MIHWFKVAHMFGEHYYCEVDNQRYGCVSYDKISQAVAIEFYNEFINHYVIVKDQDSASKGLKFFEEKLYNYFTKLANSCQKGLEVKS